MVGNKQTRNDLDVLLTPALAKFHGSIKLGEQMFKLVRASLGIPAAWSPANPFCFLVGFSYQHLYCSLQTLTAHYFSDGMTRFIFRIELKEKRHDNVEGLNW